MTQRIVYLLKIFLGFVAFFAIQKFIFIFTNAAASDCPIGFNEAFQAWFHGLSMDCSTSGYLIAIPFLAVWMSTACSAWNWRAILRPYYIIVAILISLIAVADTSLYDFWRFKLDATVFNYLDAPRQAFASVSTGYLVWRVVWIAAFAAIFSWCTIRLTPPHFPALRGVKQHLGAQSMQVLTGGLIFLAIRGGVGESTMNVGTAYFSGHTYLNHAAVNPAFNLLYTLGKNDDFAARYNTFDEQQLASIIAPLYPENTDDITDTLLYNTRPNILLIILEGFGADYMESMGGAKGVAPRMEQFMKEGVFFSQAYANSFRTDRGLVSTLSGHTSYPTFSIMKDAQRASRLPSIARSLQQAGYTNSFVYGGDINFTNMRGYFTATGYTQFTADSDFSLLEQNMSKWGVHDDITATRVLQQVKQQPTHRPWMMSYLTLSSHEPFEVPYSRLEDKRLNSFAYTDHCIGALIDSLKQLPQWKNLLVVMLPDHGSSGHLTTMDAAFYHIPIIWLGGAVKQPHTINTLMSQSDLAATLLSQLGIRHDDFPYSRNILSRHYTYPFAYSTYNDGFMYRDSTGVTLFDNASGQVTTDIPSPSDSRRKRGQAILQMSYDLLAE